jgi:hypothetical protein
VAIRPMIIIHLTDRVILTIRVTIDANRLTQDQQRVIVTRHSVHPVTHRPHFQVFSDGLVGHRSPVSELLDLNR